MTRLAIVTSHPIQYNAPVFKALAARSDLDVRVFFSWRGTQSQPDVEFGRVITWDIPLTERYPHSFVENHARHPGTHHFMGLRNPGMRDAIAAFRPDAVLVYGWSSWTNLGVLRHFHGKVPVLFRGDSTIQSSNRWWKSGLRKLVLRWVYQHIDRALYVGQRNREYFLAHGVPAAKLTWAPHSIDNDRFAGDANRLQVEADVARASLGIPQDAVAYLFAGKFMPHKQPGMLIESFGDLVQRNENSGPHLLLVGTGPLEQELRDLATRYRNIHFIGFKNQSEMPTVYRIGDVFVLPSSRETWGLAVNEALACARPVIVSDRVGCAPDLASDPRFSSVFRAGSRADLTRALATWLKPRGSILAAGQATKQFIAAWSTEAAAAAIADSVMSEVNRV